MQKINVHNTNLEVITNCFKSLSTSDNLLKHATLIY